jgi:hypothetical protein
VYQATEDTPNRSSLESGPGILVRCSSAALLSCPKSLVTGVGGIVPSPTGSIPCREWYIRFHPRPTGIVSIVFGPRLLTCE